VKPRRSAAIIGMVTALALAALIVAHDLGLLRL
jgi:ABC-type phosphonate transport system ATPase subunit